MPDARVLTKPDIERIFDGASSSYDRVGPSIFAKFGARLAGMIPLAPGTRLLDVATGTGAVVAPAAERVGPAGLVIGTDLSARILHEAEKAARQKGLKNVQFQRMDAECLDFPDESFDAVTCAFALFMFPDMEAALREMHRVCKPGGHLGVTYFGKMPPPFSPGWPVFAQLCTEYGIGARMPQKLGLTPAELGDTLRQRGFSVVETIEEPNEIVYPNGETWWGFMMTLGTRATILSMDHDTRNRFRHEYLSRLGNTLHEDGYHMSTAVLYCLARR